MKMSKQRRKARSAFKHSKRVERYPTVMGSAVTIPVVYIRGRRFTIPQCAKQRDR